MEGKPSEEMRVLKAHVALNVSDVGRSVEFYRKMLGLEPCKVRPGYAKFDVERPPLNLALNENPAAGRGALSHLGIQVASTEDVLAMRRRWAEAGLFTWDEMQTNCCYALQDKTWVADPDGNEWEVFVVLEDNLPERTMCCVGAESAGAVASEASHSPATETVAAAGSCCGPEASDVAAATTSCCAPPVGISR